MDESYFNQHSLSFFQNHQTVDHPVDHPPVWITHLIQMLRLKDEGTSEHVWRVSKLTRDWLMYLNTGGIKVDSALIEIAALLHDIGKIGVLDEVLLKPDALTENERIHLEAHADLGYQLIRDYPGFSEVADGIRHHHERWDGRGYPLGLRENQIPVASQLISIVDAFDAMTSDRPYRKARSVEFALDEIRKMAGSQFCPFFAYSFVEFMNARSR